MLGKRPRVPSMRRTISMSQMGSGSYNPVSEHVPKEKQRATFQVASQLRAAGSGHTSVQNCSNGAVLSNQIQICSLSAQFHFRLGNSDIQSQKAISNSIGAASELRRGRFFSIMEATPSVGGSSGSVYDVRVVEPAHFLQACFLCTRRLGHGQDIYMYRDDRAFCSAECRYQQIVIDENAEKHSVKVMATGAVPSVSQRNIGKNVQSRKVKNNQSGRRAAA